MSIYDDYPTAIAILDLISQGQTVSQACRKYGWRPSKLKALINSDGELGRMMLDAEVEGNDALADSLLDLDSQDSLYKSTDPKLLKLYGDNVRWLLAHRDRKRFGDSVEIKHEHTLSFNITDALDQAKMRLGGAMIDVTPRQLPAPYDDDAEILADLLA